MGLGGFFFLTHKQICLFLFISEIDVISYIVLKDSKV